MATGTVVWPAWLSLLKIMKVPFWFIWVTPTVFGYLASAQGMSPRHLNWFITAIIGTCLLEAANCVHNELVDQLEDRVNQPNRAALVVSVGEALLWRIVCLGYLGCLLGITLIALLISATVAAVMLMGGLMAPLYNWGLRVKRRPGWAELAIGWAAFAGYLWGWAWNRPLLQVSPVVWILAYFFGVTAFMKDLPDVRGDEAVNAAAIFSTRRAQLRRALLLFIAVSPYVLVTALVATGALPARFLLLLGIGPTGLLLPLVGERARSLGAMIAGYEIAFTYLHLFLLALFLLDTPTPAAYLCAVGLFTGRVLAVCLRLAPRFVEPEFSWRRSLAELFTMAPTTTSS
jgi:4-hydroxybenzoate polyprenyltransferase